MSVFRVHKTDNYTVMSNAHFKERGMSLKAKGLLSLMLSLPDTWNYSISGLVTLSKDGKDSVMSALSELEKFGYLKRKQVTNEKGQFAGVEYNIFELPQLENPIADNQKSEKQKEEKRIAEKPHQLSNKELNTNVSNMDVSSTKDKDKEDMDLLLMKIGNTELIELYWEYIDMRKEMEAPLNSKTLARLIKRCEKLSNNNTNVQKLILENSILNGWKNVFLPTDTELTLASKEKNEDMRKMLGL